MKITHIAAAACLVALAACAGRDASQALGDAEACIAQGDTAQARIYCAELADTSARALTSSQLVRQAIVYARLSELTDNPDDMGTAVECYERATALSPDSVSRFVAGLGIAERSCVEVIQNVAKALRAPQPSASDFEQEMGSDMPDGVPENVELSVSEP